jgi:hypothetical protein
VHSSQLSDAASSSTTDAPCAEPAASANFAEWADALAGAGRSARDWSGASLRGNLLAGADSMGSASPDIGIAAEDIDNFFASLIGDKWAMSESDAA